MILPNLIGRLGNQMFQCATAIAYALDNEQEWHIPTRSVDPRIWPSYFAHHANKKFNHALPVVTIKEPGHNFHKLPEFSTDWKDKNIVIEGYRQSYKYFDHRRDEILKIFNIPWQQLPDYISIHVRRGDYLQESDKHPPITLDYIRNAVLYFVTRGFKNFIVCSDDIPWCHANIQPLRVSGAEFSYSQNRREIEDIALLSCAAHQIISNSSFSWWGHYLNQNPGKICLAPNIWYGAGNSHLSVVDIYPENAIKL